MTKKSNVVELTDSIIENIKQEMGDRPIYKKTMFGQSYVFTYIDRSQYLGIQKWSLDNPNINPSDIEDKIVEYGLVWPKLKPHEWSTKPAGIISTLSRDIQEKSGLDPLDMGDPNSLFVDVIQDKPDYPQPSDEEVKEILGKVKHQLRKMTVEGRTFIIRPILRVEYVGIQRMPDTTDLEVESCKKCVVWPKDVDWSNVEAGVPTLVAKQVGLMSGFEASKIEEL
jgi:hypothetical protein